MSTSKEKELDSALMDLLDVAVRLRTLLPSLAAMQVLAAAYVAMYHMSHRGRAAGNRVYIRKAIEEITARDRTAEQAH